MPNLKFNKIEDLEKCKLLFDEKKFKVTVDHRKGIIALNVHRDLSEFPLSDPFIVKVIKEMNQNLRDISYDLVDGNGAIIVSDKEVVDAIIIDLLKDENNLSPKEKDFTSDLREMLNEKTKEIDYC